jgi:hypothetical protein
MDDERVRKLAIERIPYTERQVDESQERLLSDRTRIALLPQQLHLE